ncbi:RNA polymerase sigma factor [Niastella vici]|uniref:RNA polymerase sigma factor n=1 Tax=Niastella vici TaxID=1703345 RepID=UPI0009BDB23E|nr:sigma-70 family RNA polymerase sigma factor [Niastella vici]
MSIPESVAEKELLLQVARGSEQAFRQLFMCYHQWIISHIFRLTGSMAQAEEVAQDVFLRLWQNREVLAGIQRFKPYLFVLSRNHAVNVLKKTIKERMRRQEWEQEHDLNPLNNEEDPIVTRYTLLDEAIDQLPAQQRKVYLLSRYEQLTYTEIGERMNISRETVKKYIQIAIASITAFIKKKMAELKLLLIFLFFLKCIPPLFLFFLSYSGEAVVQRFSDTHFKQLYEKKQRKAQPFVSGIL